MNSNELDSAASRLRDYLWSLADSPNHVSVGVGNDVLHVYTKRKFQFSVPSIWENIQVIHHKKQGKVAAFNRYSYIEA